MNLSTKFAALFSISAAVAQTTTPDDESMLLIQSLGLQDELPKPGYNMEGGSVFDNYVKARRDGQFFLLGEFLSKYEKPSSEIIEAKMLRWCSNLHFTGDSNSTYSRGVGYTAHCVFKFLGEETYAQVDTAGSQLAFALTADEFTASEVLSASYNAQANMFQMNTHSNTDNYILLFSDTGLSTMPLNGWETHDEGDLSPNVDTSSWAITGQMTWISTEEAARLLNNNANDFTPEKFVQIYEKVWNDQHAYAAAQQTTTDINEESSTNEEEEESTDADTDESNGNDESSVATDVEDTTEEEQESDTAEEDDESSASNGRRLFVAVTSMFSALLGSTV